MCPVQPTSPIPLPIPGYKVTSSVPIMSLPTFPIPLGNALTTILQGLVIPHAPQGGTNWSPVADCVLLLFPQVTDQIQIRVSISQSPEGILAPKIWEVRFAFDNHGDRRVHVAKGLRASRSSWSTGVGAHHRLLPKSWTHERAVCGACRHDKRHTSRVCSLSGPRDLKLTPPNPVWRSARWKNTTSCLRKGYCIFSGVPSNPERERAITVGASRSTTGISLSRSLPSRV